MNRVLRILIFVACIPSGGALLAKVYGIAEMQFVTSWITLPCFLFLFAVFFYSKKHIVRLSEDLELGFCGGLIGTFGYDLIRVPFLLNGQRVFAPISVYGVLLLEADASSRFTEVVGWAYHFSNGIAFGIMFAVLMRYRHWVWAVGWAMLLETIAVISPFADIFALRGAYGSLFIAYLGHFAYGFPLGLITQFADWSSEKVSAISGKVKLIVFAFLVFSLVSPILNPSLVKSDSKTPEAGFIADGNRLYPGFLRVESGGTIPIKNTSEKNVEVVNRATGAVLELKPEQTIRLTVSKKGINQLYVKRVGRSHSSFLIVEPVEAAVQNK